MPKRTKAALEWIEESVYGDIEHPKVDLDALMLQVILLHDYGSRVGTRKVPLDFALIKRAHGQSYQEIAVAMAVSPSAARAAVHKALRMLRAPDRRARFEIGGRGG